MSSTLSVDENNCADGAETNDATILLSVRTSNLGSEDMVEICRQGISINDDNDPAPYNVPRQGDINTGTGNSRREGIIYPQKSGNPQNYILLISDIIHMMLYFVCHCFSCF